jgi:PadR family transcriptional regulator
MGLQTYADCLAQVGVVVNLKALRRKPEGLRIFALVTSLTARLDSAAGAIHTDIDKLCQPLWSRLMAALIRSNAGADRDEIPPGTLYVLILKTLALRERLHGFEIAEHIQNNSDDVLQVEEGSLYPALQRMLIKGWVVAEWGVTAGNRRARYYTLTAGGKKQLGLELQQFERVMGAITRILQMA